jgi:hypothetical protein
MNASLLMTDAEMLAVRTMTATTRGPATAAQLLGHEVRQAAHFGLIADTDEVIGTRRGLRNFDGRTLVYISQ